MGVESVWRHSSFVGGSLKKVRYLSDDDLGDLDFILENVFLIAKQMDGTQGFHGPLREKDAVISWFSVMATGFKHAAFSSEREWRLVLTKPHKPMPGQQFRPGKSSIVPFIEVELNKDLHSNAVSPYIIREVVVGPCPDPQLFS